jgi:hypothetical protein
MSATRFCIHCAQAATAPGRPHGSPSAPGTVLHDEAGFQLIYRPRQREAAFGHVTTLCEQVKEHTFGSIIGNVERYHREVPTMPSRRKNEKRSDWWQWNTLGGNSANFIRPLMCRPACTLYSQGNVGDRERCTAENQQGGKGKK